MDFTGKVVLITGASSGIGAGAVKYLASLGATLALSGRNFENLNTVAVECISGVEPNVNRGGRYAGRRCKPHCG